ncbi:cellulose biosynthesis protein BcsQ [Zobellella sp. DQSA1]|uniref:cellulose biosynthesis protein BcsQ n=1 Tax=Zobellella sp. DQSA1 TaxID=3342386 RepID=UPI0035C0C40B
MPVVALQGLRGGVGTTSLSAGLAWALRQLGESVLVVEFSPANQLGLHFNAPVSSSTGWAQAELDGLPWHDQALRYTEGLDFLPFGRLSVAERGRWLAHHQQHPDRWPEYLRQLSGSGAYRWILMDVAADEHVCTAHWLEAADAHLCVLTADANSHVRLHQQLLSPQARLLLNQFSVESRLQQDLHQFWRQTHAGMLPLLIHHDEAVAEALAAKQPVGEYSNGSLAADEINTLASWCLVHVAGGRR